MARGACCERDVANFHTLDLTDHTAQIVTGRVTVYNMGIYLNSGSNLQNGMPFIVHCPVQGVISKVFNLMWVTL